jgi:hypothetical protein
VTAPGPPRAITFNADLRAHVIAHDPAAAERFAGAEALVAGFTKNYLIGGRFANAETMRTMNASLVETLQAHISAAQVSAGRRIAALLVDTIDLVNRRRLLASMLTLRGFLELVASVVYFERRVVERLVTGLSTQEELDAVLDDFRRALQGSRFDWGRWWTGGASVTTLVEDYRNAKKGDLPTADIVQTNVATMIDHLEKAVTAVDPAAKGRVIMLYGMLSDMCHPAVGGDMLFVDPQAPAGWVGHLPHHDDDVISWAVAAVTLPAITDVGKIAVGTMNRLVATAKSLKEEPL